MSLKRSQSSVSLALLVFSIAACVAPITADNETPPDPEQLGNLNSGGDDEDSEVVDHGSFPKDFVAASTTLYMTADGGYGHVLYAYLPSDNQCKPVTDSSGVSIANPTPLISVGDRLFFKAKVNNRGKGMLWSAKGRNASLVTASPNKVFSHVDVYAEMGSYMLFFNKVGRDWHAKAVDSNGVVIDLKFSISKKPEILGSGGNFVAFTTNKIQGNEQMFVCTHKSVKSIPFTTLGRFKDSFVKYGETLVFPGTDGQGQEPWIFATKNP